MNREWGYYREARYYFEDVDLNVKGVRDHYRLAHNWSFSNFGTLWSRGNGVPATPTTGTSVSFSTLNLNVLSPTMIPSYNDNLITDGFFGTYTTGGVQYTWSRGLDW